MNWPLIITLALLELVGFIAIVRLWRVSNELWQIKVGWTLILLVPLFGLLFYVFLSVNPHPHADNPIDTTGVSRSGPGPGLM
jgi:hypothetical protein